MILVDEFRGIYLEVIILNLQSILIVDLCPKKNDPQIWTLIVFLVRT